MDNKSLKSEVKKNQFTIFSICFIIFIFVLNNFGFSSPSDLISQLEIAIVDFHYIYDGGYIPKNSFRKIIEKHVLIPSLKRELKEYNLSSQTIVTKNVSHALLENINLYNPEQSSTQEEYKSYDILVWGQVLPLDWPEDYDLNIFLFTNPEKYGTNNFNFILKIRNGRITSWNHRPCDFSEETIAIIPGSLCYKILKMNKKNHQENLLKLVNKNVLQRLKSFGTVFPLNYMKEIMDWYPDKQSSYPSKNKSLKIFLQNDQYVNLNLSNSIYQALENTLFLNMISNWPLLKSSLVMPDITISGDNITEDIIKKDRNDYFNDLPIEDKITIGILPMENATNREKHNWISFGLEYLLSTKLSNISVMNTLDKNIIELAIKNAGYKNTKMDINTISHISQLTRMDIALSGNYIIIGNKIKADLIFVDGFNGSQLFSNQYIRKRSNLFNLANDIVNDLIQVTALHLPNKDDILESKRLSTSIKAFEYFCLGYLEDEKPDKDMNIIIDKFKKATQQDPMFWEAQYNLGIAYYNNMAYTQAYNQFNKTIKALPSFEKSYIGRALTFLHIKEYKRAEEDFRTAVKLNPFNYLSYYYLGKLNVTLKQFEEAVNFLNKAKKLNPNFGKIYYELGNVYYAQKDLGLAIRNYEKSTKLDPKNIEGHKILGDCYYRIKNYTSAFKEFKTVLENNPDDADTNFMMGITEYQQAVLEKYIEDFLDNLNSPTRQHRKSTTNTILHKKHQVYNKMVERFYKAQKLKEGFFEATFNLALTFHEMGELDKAIIYYNKTIGINPLLIQPYLAMIKIYEEQNEKEKALEKYKEVARIEPSLFKTYPRLGEYYNNIDIIEVVIDEIEQEIMTDPSNTDAKMALAKIFNAQGFIGKAVKIYKNILANHPNNKTAKKMLSKLNQR